MQDLLRVISRPLEGGAADGDDVVESESEEESEEESEDEEKAVDVRLPNGHAPDDDDDEDDEEEEGQGGSEDEREEGGVANGSAAAGEDGSGDEEDMSGARVDLALGVGWRAETRCGGKRRTAGRPSPTHPPTHPPTHQPTNQPSPSVIQMRPCSAWTRGWVPTLRR